MYSLIFKFILFGLIGFVVFGCNEHDKFTGKSTDSSVLQNSELNWDRFVGTWNVAEVINEPFGVNNISQLIFEVNIEGVCELEVVFSDGSTILQSGELLVGSKSLIIFDDLTFAASFYEYQFDGIDLILIPKNKKSGRVRLVRLVNP
jgi:hypothetical protein